MDLNRQATARRFSDERKEDGMDRRDRFWTLGTVLGTVTGIVIRIGLIALVARALIKYLAGA